MSAQHMAHGLSLVIYSIVFSYLLLLPMLPLFGSSFFMAAARVLSVHSDRSERAKNCSPIFVANDEQLKIWPE